MTNDQLASALKYHQARQFKKAEKIYRQILQQKPNCADAHNNLGVILQARGKLAEAKKHYQKAIAIDPQDTNFHRNLGVVLWQEGNLEEAIACYQKLINIDPKDANALNSLGHILREKGNFQEAIACCEQAINLNPSNAEFHYNLGLCLQLECKLEQALICYKKAISCQPKFAEAENNQAIILQEQGKLDEAIEHYKKAISLDPKLFDAYNNLGLTWQEKGDLEEAIACYQKALKLNSNYAEAYNNLGNVWQQQGKLEAAIDYYQKALSLNASYALAYNNLGQCLKLQGKFAEALACFDRAISIFPNEPEIHKNLGIILLLNGGLERGFAEYEWRRKPKEFICTHSILYSAWNGSDLQGKTILIFCEQGYGDSIQFIRYIPLIAQRGARVILACQEPLKRLFSNIACISELVTTETVVKFEIHVLLMSLPHLLNTTLETIPAQIPYLTAPKPYPFTLQVSPETRLKVGIVWAGNPTYKDDRYRSGEFKYFLSLLDIPSIAFYSLQKGPKSAELSQFDRLGRVQDLSDKLNDFADTAAVIEQLDLVITVDTSVAHLAGALGKNVWVLLSFSPDWRWMLEREDSPWYPTMRLFRQSKLGDWERVFQRVAIALTNLVETLPNKSTVACDDDKIKAAQAEALKNYQSGRLVEAEDIYRQIVVEQHNYPPAHNNLGNILMAQGKIEEAIACYQKAVELNPNYDRAYNNLGNVCLAEGKLEDAIVYFQKALKLNPQYVEACYNLGNAFFAKRLFDEASAQYQQAISLKPNFLEAYNNLGNVWQEKGLLDEAIACYQQAIRLNPNYPEAHNNLGNIWQEKEKLAEAITCYQKVITLNPNYIEAHNNLGNVLVEKGNLEQAIACYQQAILLNPNYADAYNNLGNALKFQGNWTQALAFYRQALVLNPNFPEAHENLGMILLLYGNFRTGFAEYEWRCQTKKYLRRSFPYPLWDGSDLQGQKILLICDQGYGDAIQFIRYAPLIAELDGKVIVVCQEPLVRLFSTVASIAQLITEAIVEFDVHAPLMSLPHLMGTTIDTIPAQVPYLTAPKPYPFILRSPSQTRLKVGIVWAGSPGNQNDRNRSCKFSDFLSILKIPGITFYSLQKGLTVANLEGVENLIETLNDFADTAAAIEQLDLVITVDTSVAHLAGALGKSVWVLLSFVADWRWMLEREDSPWYPTMKLFRQTQPGDWAGVFEKVAVALENLVSDLPENLPEIDIDPINAVSVTEESPISLTLPQETRLIIAEAKAEALAHYQVGRLIEAETIYSQIIQQYPNDADTYNNLGTVSIAQGKLTQAVDYYKQSIALNSTNSDAHYNLGIAYYQQEDLEKAIASFQQALSLNPNHIYAHNNLGNALLDKGEIEEAIASFQQALALNPNFIPALNNLGNSLKEKVELAEAKLCYEQAICLEPNNAEAHKNLGIIYLLSGELQSGFAEYEWRWQTKEYATNSFPLPLWDGGELQGRTIFIFCEQGFGDSIQFIRYIPLIKQRGGSVILLCYEELQRLFSNILGIEQLINSKSQIQNFKLSDCCASLMSLPYLLCTTIETIPAKIPYLSAPQPYPFTLQAPPKTHLKVGIVWAGNPANQDDRKRSCDFSYFSSLLKLPGITFYSLQKGQNNIVLEGIENLSDKLNDFADTAAAIEQLDLVITVDTSVAHLAGALGKTVWVLLSFVPDWRWMLEREDSPWYPTMRLFRQVQPGDWAGVFEKVAVALENWVSQLQEKSLLPADGFNQLKRCRHGSFLYNINDIYIGKSLDVYGEFSEGEIELFSHLIQPNNLIVEVGANIGSHTVFFAKAVGMGGTVLAFEPQRIVFQTLCANIALNSITNTYCYNVAVGNSFGSLKVPDLDYGSPNNFGGLSLGYHSEGELTQIITIDSLNLPFCNLIKVDVEGMELQVLQGATDTINRLKPILYVENDRPEKSAALIRYIDSLGYKMYWHYVPFYNPNNYFQNSQNIFGNIVSVNMLCIHNSYNINVSGLPAVEVTSEENPK